MSRILAARPFPLSHATLIVQSEPSAYATRTLVAFGGIRRHGRIGEELAANLSLLEAGEWRTLLHALSQLAALVGPEIEREVAGYLDSRFVGLGPKQSRNLLQALGLTRYEIPLDSRLANWLKAVSFPVPVSAAALADPGYYCFVLDGIQRLCREAGVFPCELDGAVFASNDAEDWTPTLVRF